MGPPVPAKLRLTQFASAHASEIASWVQDEADLAWLSPGTPPPLTADKVCRWPRKGGIAVVLESGCVTGSSACPLGYAELNRMKSGNGNWWIGHLIVGPDRRGRGMGRELLDLLLAEAFERQAAKSVCLVVFPDNSPAIRCYESVGFRRNGFEYHPLRQGRGPRVKLLRFEMARDVWLGRTRFPAGQLLPSSVDTKAAPQPV